MSVFIPPKITTAVRQTLVLQSGELVYDTDTQNLYIGDGETAGGKAVGGDAATVQGIANNAFSSAEAALAAASEAQALANNALLTASNLEASCNGAMESADEAKGMYSTLENQVNAQVAAKLDKPIEAGSAGQVLTMGEDGTTPEWATPAAGGGHTKWGTWEDRTPGTTYTAETDGWIKIQAAAWDGDDVELMIDGVLVWGVRMDWGSEYNTITGIVPVMVGQTYESSKYQVNVLQFAPCV